MHNYIEHIEQKMRMLEQMGKAMGTIRYATIRLENMIKRSETATDEQNLNDLLKLMNESYNILEEK
jgi:hypothetical protein